MGNTPIKRNSHALGEQCSPNQRLTEQYTARQAIQLSQEQTVKDMHKEPLMVEPRTWILIESGCCQEVKDAKIAEYMATHYPVKSKDKLNWKSIQV